jgi:hypothetical protein
VAVFATKKGEPTVVNAGDVTGASAAGGVTGAVVD